MICEYRVVQHDDRRSEGKSFAIHLIYCDELGEIISYNQDPEYCSGDSLVALRLQQDMMSAACGRDILLKSQLDSKVSKRLRKSRRLRTFERKLKL